MSKIAKLVTVEITTRVIVEDTDSDEIIMQKAIPLLTNKLNGDGCLDNIKTLMDDKEMPYNEGEMSV